MKKIFLIIFLFPIFMYGQSIFGGDNIIKTNLTNIAFNNYAITYERAFTKLFSLSATYRYMPANSNVPFSSTISKIFGSNIDGIDIENTTLSNNTFTLEGRVYLSLGKMKGLYIAPYIRQANFKLSVPIIYSDLNKTAIFNGNMNSIEGGVAVGWQFQILNKIVIDIVAIGGNYGKASGNLSYTPTAALSSADITALQKKIDNINLNPIKFTNTVTPSGGNVDIGGSSYGIRALSVSVGIRF